MNLVHGLAVESNLRRVFIVGAREAHHRNPYRRAVDHPRLVGPAIENHPSLDRDLQRLSVFPGAHRVSGDEPDAPRRTWLGAHTSPLQG